MTRIHYTLPGTQLPADDLRSPTLLFHKWQGWDRFEIEWKPKKKGGHDRLDDFERNDTGVDFLQEVATAVEVAGRKNYPPWYDRFHKACAALDAETPISFVTTWRMVVGWATNPAFETGLTLEPFHGFPYVPGSAVKGLLHRVAELELAPRHCPPPPGTRLHSRPRVPLPPQAPASPEEVPGTDGPPPAELEEALTHALRLRALFGSLHLRPGATPEPATALVALEGWRDHARRLVERRVEGAAAAAWKQILPRLETVCSAAAAGGLLTCFDAVPARSTFDPPPIRAGSDEPRKLLEVDVLTPHEGTKTAILFLAVRDQARFEVRWRLGPWPPEKPRDPAEEARAEALAGLSREEALKWLKGWLRRGVTEHGLGGKTASGYGYLYSPEDPPRRPRFLEEPPPPVETEPDEIDEVSEPETGGTGPEPPERTPTEAEKEARKVLPDGIDINRASDVLNKALKAPPSEVRTATVARFAVLFPNKIDDWDSSPAPKYQKRMRQIREILGDGGGGDP